MRVEINTELGGAALEIPWASSGRPGLKYVDLRRHPEEISLLKECRNHPELAQLLRRLNFRQSVYRTVKCGVWGTARLEDEEKEDFRLPFKVAGYLDLVFRRPDFQSRIAYHLRLARKLEKSLAGLELPAQLSIVIRRCLFHQTGKWGYALTLFVHAYGGARRQASREWGRALNCLDKALKDAVPPVISNRRKRLDRRTAGAI